MADVLHRLDEANFSSFTYNQVFVTATSTLTLNGTEISLEPVVKLDIRVRTCESPTPETVFLVGKQSFYWGSLPTDIKTGLPLINE